MALGSHRFLRQCQGFWFSEYAALPGPAYQVKRLVARLGVVKVKAFVNQLPNGFVAPGTAP